MSNFGFSRLRVVNPYEIAFREAQSAVGAAELLANAEEFKSVAEAVGDCTLVIGTTAGRDRELQQPFHVLEQGADLIRTQLASAPVALLFGSEKRGLSNEDLSHCQWLLHIATRDDHVSMNLGQAVAVTLHELVREMGVPLKSEVPQLATSAELDRVTAVLYEALQESGYVNPSTASSAQEKVRRLIRRMDLSSSDAELFLGMLRQVLWRLGRQKD